MPESARAGAAYDPFERGRQPVGVRSAELIDDSRERKLGIEVWYPAVEAVRGQDLDRETQDRFETMSGFRSLRQPAVRDAGVTEGSFPLVAFSHGFGGHRRQTTHLCTHLASHGYVVASVDHTGNTMVDVVQQAIRAMQDGTPPSKSEQKRVMREIIAARPLDVSFMIDAVTDGRAGDVASSVDPDRIGVSGHSFGGWTALMVTAADRRIRSVMPLAPAGGGSPLPGRALAEALDFEWGRDVPVLYLVADRDTLLPLEGMHELFERTRAAKRMVVLENADHMHFCDHVEATHEMFRKMPPPGALGDMARHVPPIEELCSAEDAYKYIRGLGLAHMDATLAGNQRARALLDGDVADLLATHGVRVSVY